MQAMSLRLSSLVPMMVKSGGIMEDLVATASVGIHDLEISMENANPEHQGEEIDI